MGVQLAKDPAAAEAVAIATPSDLLSSFRVDHRYVVLPTLSSPELGHRTFFSPMLNFLSSTPGSSLRPKSKCL